MVYKGAFFMSQKEQIIIRIKEQVSITSKLVNKYKELTKPISPENAIGRVSRMDAINNKAINLVALRNAEIKLNNLKVALSKVDDIDFGICFKCNKIIPLGRLLLMPHSITCVNCSKQITLII